MKSMTQSNSRIGAITKLACLLAALGVFTNIIVACDNGPMNHKTKYQDPRLEVQERVTDPNSSTELSFALVHERSIVPNCVRCHQEYKANPANEEEMKRAYLNFSKNIHSTVNAMGDLKDYTKTEVYELVQTEQMPQRGKTRTPEEKNLILYWIKLGANYNGPAMTIDEINTAASADPTLLDIPLFKGETLTDQDPVTPTTDGDGVTDSEPPPPTDDDTPPPPPLARDEVELTYALMSKTIFEPRCSACHSWVKPITDDAAAGVAYDAFFKKVLKSVPVIDGQAPDLLQSKVYKRVLDDTMPTSELGDEGFSKTDAQDILLKELYLLYFKNGAPANGVIVKIENPDLLQFLKPGSQAPGADIELSYDLIFSNVLIQNCYGCHKAAMPKYVNEAEQKISYEAFKSKAKPAPNSTDLTTSIWFTKVATDKMPRPSGFSPANLGLKNLYLLYFAKGLPYEKTKVRVEDLAILSALGIAPENLALSQNPAPPSTGENEIDVQPNPLPVFATDEISFDRIRWNVLGPKCYSCHGAKMSVNSPPEINGGLSLRTYESTVSFLRKCDELPPGGGTGQCGIHKILNSVEMDSMPIGQPENKPLTVDEKRLLKAWINLDMPKGPVKIPQADNSPIPMGLQPGMQEGSQPLIFPN